MTIQQLEGFVAVAREQNFTKAAQSLYVSQPALTRQIRELEEELECVLFIRTTRSVSLTESGRRALSYAELLLEDARKMKEALIQDSQRRFTSLRIGYVTPGHVPFLERGLTGLARMVLDLDIQVLKGTPPQLLACLQERSLDCAFLHLPSVQGKKGVLFDTITRGGVIARVPRRHHLASRERLSCRDFDGESIVGSRVVSPASWDYTYQKIEGAGAHPRYIEENTEEAIRLISFSRNCIYLTSILAPEIPGFLSIPIEEMEEGFDLLLVRSQYNENPWVLEFYKRVMEEGQKIEEDGR